MLITLISYKISLGLWFELQITLLSTFSSDQGAQNNIGKMFWNLIVIRNGSYHLNVELFLSFCESWFENDEIVAVGTDFKIDTLSECRHLATSKIDSSMYFSCTITEPKHVWVVFSVAILESGNYGDCVELLSIESGIISQIMVDLMNS